MTASSADLPEGVNPGELYDGPRPQPRPAPQNVAKLHPPEPPRPLPAPAPDRYPAILRAALEVLATRLLALIAVIASCALWGLAVWEPSQPRTIAAAAFSVLVLAPLVWLYARTG
jgi:hypothetical protein